MVIGDPLSSISFFVVEEVDRHGGTRRAYVRTNDRIRAYLDLAVTGILNSKVSAEGVLINGNYIHFLSFLRQGTE